MTPLIPIAIIGLGGFALVRARSKSKKLQDDPTKLDTTNLGCEFQEVDVDQWAKANGISVSKIDLLGNQSEIGSMLPNHGTLTWRQGEHFFRTSWGVALSPGGVVDEMSTVTFCNWLAKGKPGVTCTLATDFMIFQANQAALSGDPGLILAVAEYFRSHGCLSEALLLQGQPALAQTPWPAETVLMSSPPPMPLGKDQVWLEPGARYRASAILGALGCAVPLSAIQEKLEAKGFSSVKLWSDNPWDGSWQPPDGFLECSRFGEVVWTGPPKAEKLPSQIWKIQKV